MTLLSERCSQDKVSQKLLDTRNNQRNIVVDNIVDDPYEEISANSIMTQFNMSLDVVVEVIKILME